MRVLCAWHMKNFGTEFVIKEDDGSGTEGDSHGICPECEAIEMRKIRESRKAVAPRRQPFFDNDQRGLGTSDPDPEPREE